MWCSSTTRTKGLVLLAVCYVLIANHADGTRRTELIERTALGNRTSIENSTLNGVRKIRRRRSVVQLANMLRCVSGCNPLVYKGYGCFCGYMGAGAPVDDIDRCCFEHDWCYTHISCPQLLIYFVPYRWNCIAPGLAQCEIAALSGLPTECAMQLCECDRVFAKCIRKYPCPRYKAVCKSNSFIALQNSIMRRR